MNVDKNQAIGIVIAIIAAVLLWYSMNPPKKEKCCGLTKYN